MVAAQPSLDALREILRELLDDVRRAETLVDVNIAAGLAFEALRQLT